ncbi:hypothetical protein F66182_1319 [Fusarium sp. NRRL 66182]|nr:hypothetical protein F66182_1319 [Fusarium sp. NRRL 66182]
MALSTSTEDRSSTVIAVVVVCQVLSTGIVALRLWTRIVILHAFGIDDFLSIMSLVGKSHPNSSYSIVANLSLFASCVFLEVASPTSAAKFDQNFYITIVLYTSAVMFLKLTLLAGYYRVLAVQNSRKIYIAAIILVGGWSISQLDIAIFGCSPIRGFWDLSVKSHCIKLKVMWYTNVAGNIVTDLIVLLLPIPAIVRLNLPTRQKWYLVGIFALGTFTVVISFIRIPFLSDSLDVTWVQVKSTLWSIVEITSAILCACLPTLRPFVRHYFPNLDSTLNHSGGGKILSHDKTSENPSVYCRPEVFHSSSMPKAQGDLGRDDSSVIELCNVNSTDNSARSYLESREGPHV